MYVIFFFSSRRRHTRYWRDWSSDVCSSDLDRHPTGDLHVLGELRAGVDQHVATPLVGALVGHTTPDEPPARGRDRIVRIVVEAIDRLVVGHRRSQRAVAVQRVGRSLAVQVVRGVDGAREWPLILVAPAVLAHDEDADRRARQLDAVALEVVIEPLPFDVDQGYRGLRAEVDVPGAARRRLARSEERRGGKEWRSRWSPYH